MPEDFPFDEVVQRADELIRGGAKVYFKFTCEGCGARQTFDVPNVAYKTGKCEECGHITDIERNGMNYVLVYGG